MPLICADVDDVVKPVTVEEAQLIVIELFLKIPVLVKDAVIPIEVPEWVPVILIVLLHILLLFTTGVVGPPPDEIAVTEDVPERPVNVMLLFETVSATSEGVPLVNVKETAPEAAIRSILQVFDLQLNNPIVVFWFTPTIAPVLLIVDPVVFKVLPVTLHMTAVFVVTPFTSM